MVKTANIEIPQKTIPFYYKYDWNQIYLGREQSGGAKGTAKATAKTKSVKLSVLPNILDNPIYYSKETTLGEDVKMDELINIGNMNEYKLLSILQGLSNQNTKLSELVDEEKNKIDLFKKSASLTSPQNKNKSLFVMFTNIKIYTDRKKDGTDVNEQDFLQVDKSIMENICTAELDTLVFAQNISSTTQGTRQPAPPSSGGSLNRHKYKISKFNMKALTQKQRAIKTHKSTTLKKRKRNPNQRAKTLFARRSKKYYD
jgi:hypothetical protein